MQKSKHLKVKTYYDNGLWTIQMVKNAVIKNWITPEEFEEITGRNFRQNLADE